MAGHPGFFDVEERLRELDWSSTIGIARARVKIGLAKLA